MSTGTTRRGPASGRRLLYRRELFRRRFDLLALLALALGLSQLSSGADAWTQLLTEAAVLSVWACSHAIRAADEGRWPTPLAPSLLVPAVGALVVVLVMAVGRSSSVGLDVGYWESRLLLLLWTGLLAAGSESACRCWGASPGSLAAVSLPAAAAFFAPLLGAPIFPRGTGLALLLSPVVAAGRLLGIEVAQRTPIYEWTILGVVEIHYPPWYLHCALALVLMVGFLARARRRGPHP